MPADSCHHLVEKAMKEMRNIYDYGDFVAALNKNGVGLVMDTSDIPLNYQILKFVSLYMVLPKYIGKWTIMRVPTN